MFEMLMAGVYIRVNNRYPFIENQCKDWIVSQSKKEPDTVKVFVFIVILPNSFIVLMRLCFMLLL